MSLAPMTSTSPSRKVLVEFVHLEDDVVWDARLCKQHVHVPREATRDGVDGVSDIDALLAELPGELVDEVLSVPRPARIRER